MDEQAGHGNRKDVLDSGNAYEPVVRLMLVQGLQQPLRGLFDISHDQGPSAKLGAPKLPTINFPEP